jgi:hypothetical protein
MEFFPISFKNLKRYGVAVFVEFRLNQFFYFLGIESIVAEKEPNITLGMDCVCLTKKSRLAPDEPESILRRLGFFVANTGEKCDGCMDGTPLSNRQIFSGLLLPRRRCGFCLRKLTCSNR